MKFPKLEDLVEHCGCEHEDKDYFPADKKTPKKRKKRRLAEASGDDRAEIHYSGAGFGNFGSTVVLEGGKGVDMLAAILGLHDNWQITKIGKCYAAFDGERLTVFENAHDFQNEEDFDEDDNDLDDLIDHNETGDSPRAQALKARMAKVAAKKAAEKKKLHDEREERRKKRLTGE